jgi:hypothetical protein
MVGFKRKESSVPTFDAITQDAFEVFDARVGFRRYSASSRGEVDGFGEGDFDAAEGLWE